MEFSLVAGELLPLDRLMRHFVARVGSLTHVRHVKVMRYRPAEGDLIVEAGVGWRQGVVGQATFPTDSSSPPGRSVQTGVPVVIPDLPNDPDYRYHPVLRDHGIISVLNVPVMIGGRTWGVLELDSDEPRSFGQDDATFLGTAANILGGAALRHQQQQELAESAAQHARELAFSSARLVELHHRVKNNFQSVIALLNMQRRRMPSEELRRTFTTAMDRIYSVSLVHDQLALAKGNGSDVTVHSYFQSMCGNIAGNAPGIIIDVDVEPESSRLAVDRAVPLGLILNELVTNSLKYAFDDGGGTINVVFRARPDTGEAELVVEDNGRGLSADMSAGTGSSIVKAFAAQLKGEVAWEDATPGTRAKLIFPIPA